jgi:hypothetical protein
MVTHTLALGLALQATLLVATGSAPARQSDGDSADPTCGASVGYRVGESVTFPAANRLGVDGPMAAATYMATDGAVVTVTTYRYQTPERVAEAVADLESVAPVESVAERCEACAARSTQRRLVIGPVRCGRGDGYRIIRASDVAFTVIAARDVSHALDVECLLYREPASPERPPY